MHEKTDLNEQMVRDTCRFLSEAVKYIHFEGIVYRNISPELASEDDITSIRVGGFGGCACYLRDRHNIYCVGSPMYMAREIIQYKFHGKVRTERGEGKWYAFCGMVRK